MENILVRCAGSLLVAAGMTVGACGATAQEFYVSGSLGLLEQGQSSSSDEGYHRCLVLLIFL